MEQRAGSPDPSLHKAVLGMELYHHTTVLKSPCGQRLCPPSASQDSAVPPHSASQVELSFFIPMGNPWPLLVLAV